MDQKLLSRTNEINDSFCAGRLVAFLCRVLADMGTTVHFRTWEHLDLVLDEGYVLVAKT